MNIASTPIPRRLVALTAALLAIPLIQTATADAGVSAGIVFPTLKVTGDGLSDNVALRLRPGDATTLDVDLDDNGTFEVGFDRDTFNSILVDMGAGTDSVRIDDSAGVFTDTEATKVFGGDGNDTLTGGAGLEDLNGGGGADTITGGEAADVVHGGPGDDTFRWKVLDGDDVITGDEGSDGLAVQGSGSAEQFTIARLEVSSGEQVRVSRAGSGRDGGANDVLLGAVEKLRLNALGGDDSIIAAPDVGELISLNIAAGVTITDSELSATDDDFVAGTDAADVISGGLGSDRLDGQGGADTLSGDDDADILIGGSGADALSGGAGADEFQCDGPGEVLDAQPEDLVPAFCLPPAEPAPTPAPAPLPAPTSPAASSTSTGLPTGFLGFAKPVVRATRRGLRVIVTNVHSAPIDVKVAVSERFRTARGIARTARYRGVRKTIPAGARATLRLQATRALRTRIAAQLSRFHRVVRRPVVTVTNVPTAGKRTVRPRLTLTDGSR